MRAEMLAALAYRVTEFDIDGYRRDHRRRRPAHLLGSRADGARHHQVALLLAEDDSQFSLPCERLPRELCLRDDEHDQRRRPRIAPTPKTSARRCSN
ncbi:MAG: hypothetical protein MZU97_14000 [Bacillus subtilis]|nr:hypothetical protein [Bacillus subtilis]